MSLDHDPSSRAGLLLGAVAIGASYQRSLLSRGSTDQALITGVAATSGYLWGSTAHSVLRSAAERLSGPEGSARRRRAAGLAVDAVVLAAGAAVVRSAPAAEHEPGSRALIRLAAGAKAAAAGAGLAAAAMPSGQRFRARLGVDLGAAVAAGGLAYGLTRPTAQITGADTEDGTSGQDSVHGVSAITAAAVGTLTTGALLGLAHGESQLATGIARAASRTLGGKPADYRALGRLGATTITAAAAWTVLSAVVTKLTTAGEQIEIAHAQAPEIPEITGSPESHIDWSTQSREGRRWLSMALRPDRIADVMGEPARQPIRIYASLGSAATPQERAALLLREIDRTRALERSVFALFSPTGSGYVNYVADETLEYLTRGDCASAAIEYSVLPSALSLTRVHMGTEQTRMVVNGVVERLLAMPVDERARFVLFGESLGSQVSEEMFLGSGMSGPAGAGLDAAVWIGTPQATKWRDEIWGLRSMSRSPEVGAGAELVSRCVTDWTTLRPPEKDKVRFLLLQNGDDPIPKFGAPVLWRRPDWLGPDSERPPGAPLGTRWLPVTTFMATFVDMMNALTPTPGEFAEGGHDYRLEVPEAVRSVWRLDATDAQMARVQAALRQRELGWETYRRWTSAKAAPDADRSQAEAAIEEQVAGWTGQTSVDAEAVERLIGEDTQPT